MERETIQKDPMLRHYIATALWSSTDESDECGGDPLDDNYGVDDLADETLAGMAEDCAEFERQARHVLDKIEDLDYGLVGHDFWLTRNGHGAGFWDGNWGAFGDELTELCKPFGECYLYVGDDGMIYSD